VGHKVTWACPKCGAHPDTHGKGGYQACLSPQVRPGADSCSGFLCECHDDSPGHGESIDKQCLEARCYHCGWCGEFPQRPFTTKDLPQWAKTAWAAGWRPPPDWLPPGWHLPRK
jgi:hypothetical protein